MTRAKPKGTTSINEISFFFIGGKFRPKAKDIINITLRAGSRRRSGKCLQNLEVDHEAKALKIDSVAELSTWLSENDINVPIEELQRWIVQVALKSCKCH